ncbi:MAG: SLC13 family permease [Chitinophagales bacterium]|nr:SLC13 family permease [Chitinophagales bacterium]
MPQDLQIIIVSAVILFLVIALYMEFIRPTLSFLFAIVALLISGIIGPKEVLEGFSNEQIAVIIVLVILADCLRKTDLVTRLFETLFKGDLSYKGFLWRLTTFVSFSSAWVNNTPIVALLIPYVQEWGKKNKVAASKLLIPLSYATIMGGMATLIGTSTNLIVSGLMVESGLRPLNMFEFSAVGIPIALLGILYFQFIGHRLLPIRKDPASSFSNNAREYLTECVITSDSVLIGKSIEAANLGHPDGLYLVELIRHDQKISPVPTTEELVAGDLLIFAGNTERITELIRSDRGIVLSNGEGIILSADNINFHEVVINPDSYLVGKNVNQTDFRPKYDASIVGIHRNGEKLAGKIGDIKMKSGDLMLILPGPDFNFHVAGSRDLLIIGKTKTSRKIGRKQSYMLLGSTVIAIALAAFGLVNLFSALIIAAGAMLLLKVIRVRDVKEGLDLNLIIMLAFALAIGKALSASGAAKFYADGLIAVLLPFGVIGVLAGIYLITNVLTAFMTNAASVAITIPIALSTCETMGLNPIPFMLGIAFAGSGDFITPIGYQTNLMVYGPGGYKFRDYVKVGFPLTILYMVLSITILGYVYDLY